MDVDHVEDLLDAVSPDDTRAAVDAIVEIIMARNNTMQASDTQTANALIILVSILMTIIIVSATVIAFYNANTIAKPLARLAAEAFRIAKGDVSHTIKVNSGDEIGKLSAAFIEMVNAIKEQSVVIEALAGGDYTRSITARSENDVMNRAIQDMIDASNSAFADIANASAQVSAGARQIAQGAQNLAEGSTEQAASIQELSASITDVHTQTVTNAQSANRALEATTKAGEYMAQGIRDMGLLTQAMQAISDDSTAIGKIIKVIDDIASNTTLLSLNASVEAARVGEHGKGFAVVASEVRNLASKSADAAKETAELIAGNAQRVNDGNEILARTNESLNSVAEQARITSDLVSEIAKASQEQAAAISEINVGIDQISTVVQGNSATAQESAAAAEEMSSQSSMLDDVVRRFKIKSATALAAPRASKNPTQAIPASSVAKGLGKY
jgi:methyl-accepting chemotaxis protein